MSVLSMLNKTCTIRRNTPSQSGTTAGQVPSWSDVSTSVRCAVQPASQREQDFGHRESGVSEYTVYFIASTDVRNGDMLTTITGLTGVALEVTSPPNDAAGRGKYTRVTAVHRIGWNK